jgi:DNA-binding transcriptional regulator YdaS (Cro superfamily)
MIEPHNPIKAIVSLFGGQHAMARTLELPQSTISSWVKAARIPSKRIPAIVDAATRLDLPVELTLVDFFPEVEQ